MFYWPPLISNISRFVLARRLEKEVKQVLDEISYDSAAKERLIRGRQVDLAEELSKWNANAVVARMLWQFVQCDVKGPLFEKGARIGEVQRAISLWNLKMEIWLFQVSSRKKKVHSRVTLNKFKNWKITLSEDEHQRLCEVVSKYAWDIYFVL